MIPRYADSDNPLLQEIQERTFTIDNKILLEILQELVPKSERSV